MAALKTLIFSILVPGTVAGVIPWLLLQGSSESSDEATWSRESSVGDPPATTSSAPSRLLTDPLLATKLHVPRPRPQLVHRPRLIQRLQQSMERPFTRAFF